MNKLVIFDNVLYQFFCQLLVPGPPFVGGALMVIAAMIVAVFIPKARHKGSVMDPLLLDDSIQLENRSTMTNSMIG